MNETRILKLRAGGIILLYASTSGIRKRGSGNRAKGGSPRDRTPSPKRWKLSRRAEWPADGMPYA